MKTAAPFEASEQNQYLIQVRFLEGWGQQWRPATQRAPG